MRRAAFYLFAIVVPAFASCAGVGQEQPEQSDLTSPDASTTTPAEAGTDASLDGGCDSADPSCGPRPLSCDAAAWCPVPTSVNTLYRLTSVWGSGKDDVWAVGSGGTIIHYDGSAWKPTPPDPPTMNTFYGVWGSGAKDVWVV